MNKGLSLFFILVTAAAGFGQTNKQAAPGKKAVQPAKPLAGKPQGTSSTKKAATPSGKSTISKANPAKVTAKPVASPTPDPEADKTRFQQALAGQTAADKARLLRAFLDEFPSSDAREEAVQYLVTARAIVGSEKLQAGDATGAAASFALAVDEAPAEIPERLFNDVIVKFPANLFYRGERQAALDLARHIEKKVATNTKQLLGLVSFFLSIENGSEARRVAERVVSIDAASVAGYQALGLANRLNFDLEESAKAYAKALELDPASVPAQRSLAEMKRALGKPDEAAAIYRSILSANENDIVARSGLALSLFDSGKQADAESELAKALTADPKNFGLLAGAAYWYAANNNAAKAAEYGQKAVDAEPRYVWGHIALARGLMKQGKPVDAERALIRARQYGNFPSLEYEIASARFQAGFFREAVEELSKSFTLENGMLRVKVGGRVLKEAPTFQELVSLERKASILQPAAADDTLTGSKLRTLLEIKAKAEEGQNEVELAALADEFVKGDDKMKLHRQLHVADLLLQKNAALPKVAELIKASVGNTDAGLEVPAPAAAVMASELYESRTIAFSRNEVILVPEVPRQTLSAILRGRIEELAGWTLYQQKNYPDAVIRLRRAISVLPDKSAWWRSSQWRLGAALEADGKEREALDSYIQSYKTDRPSGVRYGVIEALYRKINGGPEGLEEKIGPNPGSPVAAAVVKASPPEAEPTPARAIASAEPTTPAVEKRNEAEPVVPRSVDTSASLPPAREEKKLEVEARSADPRLEPEKLNVRPRDDAPANARTASTETVSGSEQKKPADQPIDTGIAKPLPKITSDAVKDESPEVRNEAEKTELKSASTVEAAPTKANPDASASAEIKPEQEASKPVQKADTDPDKTRRQNDAKPVDTVERAPDPVREEPKPAGAEPQRQPETEPSQRIVINDSPAAAAKPEASAKKPLLIVEDPLKKEEKTAKSKDLFDPVVINVPRREVPQKTADASPSAAGSETASSTGGSTRRRLVEGKEIVSDQQCSIEVSQDSISLLNGGGSLGILVSVPGEAEAKEITASSSSTRDIEVRSEPEIAGLTGRRFFVIKSISSRIGLYQVNFESPCGKKEITVRVR